MEYLHKAEIIEILKSIETKIERIQTRNVNIHSVNDFLLNESGMEKLDAACMLIQSIGENIKSIEKKTSGNLLINYPEIPWNKVIRMRDFISHHYDGVDADFVFEIIKHNLPPLLQTIQQIKTDLINITRLNEN